jgi:Concanavalin A-like lectin/glucanases superfamily/PEP-CTERM motif
MSRLGLFATVTATMLCAATAHGVLVNQYTFNDGTANDSGPGAAHGNVVDPSGISQYVGGQLDLSANNGVLSTSDLLNANNVTNGAFVDLPNGIVTSALQVGQSNAASFEMWVTIDQNRNWARLFDFGTSNLGEDTSTAGGEADYLMMVPLGFAAEFAFESHPGFLPGAVLGTGAPLATSVEHHIVVTYDQNDTTAGPGGTANVYLNNALAVSGAISPDMPLGSLTSENNDWLGRSQYGGDVLIDAFYNEFNIYDHVLSATEVANNNAEGPVAAPLPTLVIDRLTGAVTIENQSDTALQLTSYSVTSAVGGLSAPGSWDPIAPTNSWTIQTQADTEIAEMGGTPVALAGGGSVDLGDAWIPTMFEDLQFSFELTGGTSGLGQVQFTGNGGAPFGRSDLDTDGDLDVADWTVFLAGNGTDLGGLSTAAAYLQGDLNGDNENNHSDFVLFRLDYIAANGAAAFAELTGSVPEPSALALAALASIAIASVRRRRSLR